MAKILITGIAGLLGNHFSRYLYSLSHDVVGIDDFSGGYKDLVHEDIPFYEHDLSENPEKLHSIFLEEKPEFVYHFAAYAAKGLSPFIRNFNYKNNVISSANVINECIKNNIKKIIFTSSMAVYGEGNPPYNEDQLLSPEEPYGIAKYAVEMDLKQAFDQFGLNYTIIRPHNVVGIYQNIWDKYRNVIGIWIRQVLNNEPLTIFGDGEQRRAFSDIQYYMKPFEKVMEEHNDDVFNIGAAQDYKIIDAAKLLQKVAKERGYVSDIRYLESRHEPKVAYCDHTKAKKHLNFEDNTDLEKIMYDMFNWALTQPNREVKHMDYEIEKGMYSFWKK